MNKCPAKRQRDSQKKKGKNPFENREHPRGMKGKQSWNHGLKTPDEVRQKISSSLTSNEKVTGRASTDEKELLRRKKISETAKIHKKSGGYRKGSGIGHGGWYESPIAGHVYLDSTWELSYAKFLDESSIQWKRNTQRFAYQYNGELHYYIPDFFLVEKELFIEVKGYETAVDRAKWKQFPHKLQVIRESDLRELKLI